MSEFDSIRRRKQGSEARERVLSRVGSGSSGVSTAPVSEFDAIRNRQDPAKVETWQAMNERGAGLQDKAQRDKEYQANSKILDEAGMSLADRKFDPYSGKIQNTQQPKEKKSVKDKVTDFVTDAGKTLGINREFTPEEQATGRSLPGIGMGLSNLDRLAKETKPFSDVAQSVYTPAAGFTAMNAGARAVGALVSRLAPRIGNGSGLLARSATRAAEEAAVGGTVGAGNVLARNPESSGREIAEGAAFGAGAGAVTGAAGPVLSDLATNLFKSYIKRVRPPVPAQTAPEQLMLGSGQQRARGNINQAQTPDVVYGRGKVEPLGLPEPDVAPPTTGRVERVSNPYRAKLERLFEYARTLDMPPGREREYLDDVWSRMASREDPSLDELIDLAYPPNRPPKVNPGSLRSAREAQGRREVYGVPLKAKTLNERYSGGVQGVAADPVERVGRRPGASARPAPRNQQIISDTVQPTRPRIDVTPESQPITQQFDRSKPSGSLLGDIRDSIMEPPQSGISAFGRRGNEYDRSALNDTKSQLVTKTQRETMTPGEAVQSGYRKMVDDFYRFKDFDELAKRTLGRELKPSEQAHKLALNSRGSDMTTRHVLTEEMVDINGNKVGQSLKNASQQIPKNKLIDFEDYQVLKHALWRMKRGEKVYRDDLDMDLNKVAQKVFDYETQNPQFKKINEEFLKYSENLTKNWLVDTGIVGRQTLDGYLENNPFYAPNMRQFLKTEKGMSGRSARAGFSQGNPIKKAVGSQRKIISPTESRIEQTDQYIKVGKRNQVLQTVIKMAEKDPEAFEGFIEVLPMTDNMKYSELLKLNDVIDREGIDGLVVNMNEAFDQMFNAAKQGGKKELDNVLPVMFDGKPTYVRINDAPFLEALTAMTPQAQGVILEAARQTTRVMKMLTTGLNPIFSLTRNLIRDIPMSYVASKTVDNPLRFAWDLADSVVQILGNKDLYKSFKAVGGGHSSSIAADRNLLSQSKAAVLPQRNRLRKLPGKALGVVENFTNALETAPRLGEYKRITKAGNNSPDSKIEGLFQANDVTVNFKRRGSVGREIDAFLPYFNAAIQGLDKSFRTFKDRPLAAAMKAVVGITIPTLITYALNHNDPNYKKLDNRTKDMYYLLPNGDGTFTKLPKPREAGTVFGSGIERILRKWDQDDPEAFKGFAETVRFAFSPPGVSGLTAPGLSAPERLEAATVGDSILGPLSDIRSNKDYANRPIVPGNMEGISPELQFDERTSDLSKWLGDKLNSSPKQLDYLLKSYTGIIGQLGVPLNSENGSIKKVLKQQVTADPVYSNGISTEFYNTKNKLDTAYDDYKKTGEMSKDFNDPLRKYFDKVSGRMSDVRTTIRTVQADKSISKKDKENKLKDLQLILNSLGESAIEISKKSDKSMVRESE